MDAGIGRPSGSPLRKKYSFDREFVEKFKIIHTIRKRFQKSFEGRTWGVPAPASPRMEIHYIYGAPPPPVAKDQRLEPSRAAVLAKLLY